MPLRTLCATPHVFKLGASTCLFYTSQLPQGTQWLVPVPGVAVIRRAWEVPGREYRPPTAAPRGMVPW